MTDTATAASRNEALTLLERQAASLERVRARASAAFSIAPVATFGEWRGPAQLAFETALMELHGSARRALHAIEEALALTRQAITTLAGHVG